MPIRLYALAEDTVPAMSSGVAPLPLVLSATIVLLSSECHTGVHDSSVHAAAGAAELSAMVELVTVSVPSL